MPSTLDSYSLPARGIPFAAVLVPPLVLLGAGAGTTTGLGIASGLVLNAAPAVAGQLGRDRGRRLQAGLWEGWGGSPTIQRLRFRTGGPNPGRGERLHGRIEQILGEALPSAVEEAVASGRAGRG